MNILYCHANLTIVKLDINNRNRLKRSLAGFLSNPGEVISSFLTILFNPRLDPAKNRGEFIKRGWNFHFRSFYSLRIGNTSLKKRLYTLLDSSLASWYPLSRMLFYFYRCSCLFHNFSRAKPNWLKIEVSNGIVAVFTAGFTYLFLLILRVRSSVIKFIFGLLWILLLPNTSYLFTDLGHIPYQWTHTVSPSGRLLLLIEYLLMELFAIMTFLFSSLPFGKIIEQVNIFKKRKVIWLILFNFLVAYGMVLGRFEHINSQVVFTNPLKVLRSAINIFVSFDLLSLTILFGLLCNFIYFLFRALFLQRVKKYYRIFD